MLPDFWRWWRWRFAGIFVKSRVQNAVFKHGKCGHGVVKSMDDSAFDCTVFGAI
jgi:hypothetical protein